MRPRTVSYLNFGSVRKTGNGRQERLKRTRPVLLEQAPAELHFGGVAVSAIAGLQVEHASQNLRKGIGCFLVGGIDRIKHFKHGPQIGLKSLVIGNGFAVVAVGEDVALLVSGSQAPRIVQRDLLQQTFVSA